MANDVKCISAANNELWAVLDSVSPATLVGGIVTALQGGGGAKGILARRGGITPDNPLGTGWDISAGVINYKTFGRLFADLSCLSEWLQKYNCQREASS